MIWGIQSRVFQGLTMADTATRTKTVISTVVLHLKVNNNDYILLQSPSPLPDTIRSSSEASFKPSMAVVIGIITTMFSVTFLLLMYAKHCKRNTGGDLNQSSSNWISRNVNGSRRRSGIDRAVVESLPMFRFGSLSTREKKLGLECCVCLNKYKDDREILRLLPKCNHTFHVECVDTWLDFHSTCPLCRFRVDPEDVLLSIQRYQQQSQVGIGSGAGGGGRFWRVSGRHSSAGETSSSGRLLQRQPPPPPELDSARKSLDSIIWRKKEKELAAGGGGRVGSAPSAGATAGPTTSTVGCRKDGLLMVMSNSVEYKKEGMTSDERLDVKMDDRMRVSSGGGEAGGTRKREIEERTIYQHRWSDLRPSDLLFLRSKKERGHVHRHSSSSLVSPSSSWISFLKQKKKAKKNQLNNDEEDDENNGVDEEEQVVMMNGSRSSTEA